MTVRDLGYRAYEGELRPASQNVWVMLRYGLWRIWGSWMNRLVVFFFWLPFVLYAGMAWREPLVAALTAGCLALTRLRNWPFLAVATLAGSAGWPLLWMAGPWVAGDEYAGLFVRVMPEERGPVVNMVTGATVAMAFLDGRS